MRALLELIRRENPELQLILSPIPSYELVHQSPDNESLRAVLDRLPISYEGGVAEELALHESLRDMAREAGWTFVDNLAPLLSAPDRGELYNEQDYHIQPAASRIIGRNQAHTIMTYLEHLP
jgi:hypothetical protein